MYGVFRAIHTLGLLKSTLRLMPAKISYRVLVNPLQLSIRVFPEQASSHSQQCLSIIATYWAKMNHVVLRILINRHQ
jgi:hypothetical protein